MRLSKQMVIGWMTLLVAILALPQLAALVPEAAMPWVACVSGILVLAMRWLGGALGANPLSAVGVVTLLAGLLSVPELLAVIPATAMPYVTALTGIATLVARFLAGSSPTDPAPQVGFVLRVGG